MKFGNTLEYLKQAAELPDVRERAVLARFVGQVARMSEAGRDAAMSEVAFDLIKSDLSQEDALAVWRFRNVIVAANRDADDLPVESKPLV